MLNTTTATVKSNTTAGQGFTIKQESAGKIIGMLINMYSSPVTPIRELAVNGIEAHQLKQQATGENPGSVVIEIEDDTPASLLSNDGEGVATTATVTITDYGVGMSEQEFRNIFLNIAMSSKDTSDEFVGGFGIGSKSVFMLSPTVDFTTTKNGKTTRAIISLTGNGTDSVITTTETGADSGTIVRFTIDQDKREAIVSRIGSEFTNYAEPGTVRLVINGQEIATSKKYKGLTPGQAAFDKPYCITYYTDDYKAQVTVVSKGDIPYRYTVENVSKLLDDEMVTTIGNYGRILSDFNASDIQTAARRLACFQDFTVRLDLTRDDITPSRESLIQSASLDKRIICAIVDTMEAKVRKVTETIATAQNASEYVSLLRNDAVVSEYAENIVDQIVGVSDSYVSSNLDEANRLYTVDSPQVALCGEQSFNKSVYSYGVRNPFGAVFYNFEKSVKLNAYVDNYGKDCDLVNRIGVVLSYGKDYVDANAMKNALPLIPEFALKAVDYEELGALTSYLELLKALFDVETVDAQELRAQAMKVGGELHKANGGSVRKVATKAQGIKFSMAYRENGKFVVRHYANVTDIANELETGGELDHITALYNGVRNDYSIGEEAIWEAETGLDLFNALLHVKSENFTLTESEFNDVMQVFGDHDAIVVATGGAKVENIATSMERRNNGRTLSYRNFGYGLSYRPFVIVECDSKNRPEKLKDVARDDVLKAMKVQLFLNTRSDLNDIANNGAPYYYYEPISEMAKRVIFTYSEKVAGWKRIQEVFGNKEYFKEMFVSPEVDGGLQELAQYLQDVYGNNAESWKSKDVEIAGFIAPEFEPYTYGVNDLLRKATSQLNVDESSTTRNAGVDRFSGLTTSKEHREIATLVLEVIFNKYKEVEKMAELMREFAK